MSDSLTDSSIGVIRCTLQISDLKLFKGCSHSFHPISTKLYGKYDNQSGLRGLFLHICICRVLFIYDSFEFRLGSFGAFAKFPMLRFSKSYCSPSLQPASTKLYGIRENVGYYFGGNLPNFKNIWHFEDK